MYNFISAKIEETRNIRLETKLFGIYLITLFFVAYNPSTLVFSEVPFVLFATIVFIKAFLRGKIKFNPWMLTIFMIMIFSIISVLWAILPEIALGKGKSIVQMGLLFFLVYQSVNNEQEVNFIFNAYLLGVFLMFSSILLNYGMDGIIGAFSSSYRLGLLVNEPNALGRYSAIAFIICLYKAILRNNKKYYIVGLICIFMVFASGSRQAFLILIAGIFILLYLNNTYNLYKFISIVFVALSLLYLFPILVDNLPIFNRYNNLFDMFLGKGFNDGSLSYRSNLIKLGLEMFQRKPVFGYGTGQFVALCQSTYGIASASHNGFIELLVSFGVIVTIIYYSLFLRIITKVNRLKESYNCAILFLTIFIMIILAETAHIGIYDKFTYIFLGLGLSISSFKMKEKTTCI
jgi:O-antigen ligase